MSEPAHRIDPEDLVEKLSIKANHAGHAVLTGVISRKAHTQIYRDIERQLSEIGMTWVDLVEYELAKLPPSPATE